MTDTESPSGIDAAEAPWRAAQVAWSASSIAQRLEVLTVARHHMASQAFTFASALSPELARTPADTMIAEVLPLLEACRFLEREAEEILKVRRLGRRGLPFWLAGLDSEIRRVALGKVLVIGPANYPLFLPAVQTLQALAAGNAVVWKPGRGGQEVAELFAKLMYAAGLSRQLLRVTQDGIDAARMELKMGAHKVFFTGSAEAGRELLHQLAETATPSVMELSGCDAVIVLPSADLERVVKALAFGMRLNGSATCMAPRRLFLVDATGERRDKLVGQILSALERIKGIRLPERVQGRLRELLEGAARMGVQVHREIETEQRPVLVTNVNPGMEITRADISAPLLMLLEVRGGVELLSAVARCPYALTTAVFGEEREARALAKKITAGTVLVNDLIVPTADPRVPFGGRSRSGFGVTRGSEGLLEMTAVKVVSVRQGKSVRHYEATTERHENLFNGLIMATHAGTLRERWKGVKQLATAARTLKSR